MILIRLTAEAIGAETREAFVTLMTSAMTVSQGEAGCVEYRFTADLNDTLRFHLVELWETEADVAAHMSGPVFREFVGGLPAVGRIVSSTWMAGELAPFSMPGRSRRDP